MSHICPDADRAALLFPRSMELFVSSAVLSYRNGSRCNQTMRLLYEAVHDSYESSCFSENLTILSTGSSGVTHRVNSEALLSEVQSSV